MPTIEIEVKNKIAKSPAAQIVCGNSDYQIKFAFDDEWMAHNPKTARFSYNGQYEDVVFEGDTCPAPVISGTTVCAVGVFAGNLRTTTPALVSCAKSILCENGLPRDPSPDVYQQIIELLNKGGVANGVPAGGKAGQLLYKKSDKDFDVEWRDMQIPEQYGLVTYDQDKTITIS